MPYDHNPFTPSEPHVPEPVEPHAPTGTSREVLAWVGDDKDRAQLAIDDEKSSSQPRKSLLKDLEKVLEDE